MRKTLLTFCVSLLISILLVPTVLAWELDRPRDDVEFYNERLEGANTDGKASIGLGVDVFKYYEHDPGPPAEGNDYIKLWVVATGNSREIITYDFDHLLGNYEWHEVNQSVDVWDEDGFGCIYLNSSSYPVRFYGSRESAEYREIYISENGFITFDLGGCLSDDPYDPYKYCRYYLGTIPSTVKPDNFIAPFWRDLDLSQGGSVTWGEVIHHPNPFMPTGETPCYVISWNNVSNKKNGIPQSFQIVIEKEANPLFKGYPQRTIWFQYKQVTLDDETTVGIEDQLGHRGLSDDHTNLSNETTLCLSQSSNSAFIQSIKINLNRQDDENALIKIIEDSDYIRSYHLKAQESEEGDTAAKFAVALAGAATLLIGIFFPEVGLLMMAGLMAETFLVGLDWAEWYASMLKPTNPDLLEIEDDGTPLNQSPAPISYVAGEAKMGDDPVRPWITVGDVTLGICVFWIFTDDNCQNHNLAITAELKYAEVDTTGSLVGYNTVTLEQPVELTMTPDVGDDFDPAEHITEGFYRGCLDDNDTIDIYAISIPYTQIIDATMTPCRPTADFNLFLYDASRTQVASSTNLGNATEHIVHTAHAPFGDWYIKVERSGPGGLDGNGIYNLTLDLRPVGGGCPFVYCWDGQEYMLDNNLLPASEVSSGANVDDYYRLEQTLIPKYKGTLFSWYSLQIREFENEHSHLDQVRLLAVDHESDVNVAVTLEGEILTYKNPQAPVSCIDNYGNDVLETIEAVDNSCYQGFADDYLMLDFGSLDISDGAKLVMRADQKAYYSVNVQVLDSTQNWKTVATVHPRALWATEIVDLTDYLPDPNGDLKVRLYFTAKHKLDYVALDTTLQVDTTTRYGILVSATHSQDGQVTFKLLFNDENYAELVPSQQIQLTFILRNNPEATRTFILYTNGHYHTITPQNP